MAHICPTCSCTCHCGGDIDDIHFILDHFCDHCDPDDDYETVDLYCEVCAGYGNCADWCPNNVNNIDP